MSNNNSNLDKYQNLESISDIYFFYPLADLITPFFHDILKLKPNHITTLGFISRLYSAYLILCKKYLHATGFFLVGYLFDSMDGRMARKYNEGSLFGEAWDSVSDTISTIIVIGSLLYVNKGKLLWWQWLMLILFIVFINIWTYSQESWTTFQKVGHYDFVSFKKDKFKNESNLIPRIYILINDGSMGIDALFNLSGGFGSWKKLLLGIMPYIGCGNLIILLCLLILSFYKK